MTKRQQYWAKAAEQDAAAGNTLAAGLFSLIAQPNEQERGGHDCRDHSGGFSRQGRRGFKCQICGKVLKWVDPDPKTDPDSPLYDGHLRTLAGETVPRKRRSR